MIQVNLLPDVKLTYVRAQRVKRLVITFAVIASAVALFILIVMVLVVDVFQKKYLHDINGDISTSTHQLQATPDLNKILTVQNQLNSLTNLHNQKPVSSRLVDYLAKVVPASVNISNFTIDFDQHTMEFTGITDTLSTVNTFVDTLKFTTFSTNTDSTTKNAFSSVVLTSFGISDDASTGTSASYTIDLGFDPIIFDNSQTVSLGVPQNKITTRSESAAPNDLFKAQPVPAAGN